MQRSAQHKKRGVALITAILIVTLATILATSITARRQIDLRRTQNMLYHEQAYLYLMGAEDWAKQILARDMKNNDTDSYKDDWATILPPQEIEGGKIGGTIDDVSGRFNLNNLGNGDVNSVDAQRFRKLLEQAGASVNLVNAVMDWIDTDQEVRFPEGAEDVDYLYGSTPYRAANRLFQSPSELLLIKGFTYEIYEKLAPLVIALPDHTEININTAPAGILLALVEELTAGDAQKLVEERKVKPFKTVDEFLGHDAIKGKKINSGGLSVKSRYFLLTADVEIGRNHATMHSLIRRADAKSIRIMQRTEGEL